MMDKQLFQLKFTSKQMNRLAKKCEKDEAAEKLKVKKAIEKGDPETARIYAQNAVRIKNTSLGYLRLSSRLDAVASRVESSVKMQTVTKQMGAVTKGMDKFEASFDDVAVRSDYIEGAMNAATASS